MANPSELLAGSLKVLETHHLQGQYVFASSDLAPAHLRRLKASGYLAPIMRGWHLTSRPGEREGDTTPWRAYWREFISRYAKSRFGKDWYLSPEWSLAEQVASSLGAKQIQIHAKAGTNNVVQLIHGWSLLDYGAPNPAPEEEIQDRDGLQLLSIPYALTQVGESFFRNQKPITELAIGMLQDPADVGRLVIRLGKPVVGGRIVGALRAAHREVDADELRKTMAAHYKVEENNPFETPPLAVSLAHRRSPYMARIETMWQQMRSAAIDAFPEPPGLPEDIDGYLRDVDSRYASDAYHSLSIEGYTVTPDLIERVRSGKWNPDSEDDRQSRDAMAAKGYAQAHESVTATITKVLQGENPGNTLRTDHRDWYRALFDPSVKAGILRPESLAGYRNHPVYIKGADHVPPPVEAVRDCMPEFFTLLEGEDHPAARAVLGHFIFVFVHPYMDGNGRIGRFMMNAMLASGGYPWTIIPVDERSTYFNALNEASARSNVRPFAEFIAAQVSLQIELKPTGQRRLTP
jgi:fido (protein-threonine AMPylation protein)